MLHVAPLVWVMPHDHSSHGMASKTLQLLADVLHCETSVSSCKLNWPAALNLYVEARCYVSVQFRQESISAF